jgi:hypothetical protein
MSATGSNPRRLSTAALGVLPLVTPAQASVAPRRVLAWHRRAAHATVARPAPRERLGEPVGDDELARLPGDEIEAADGFGPEPAEEAEVTFAFRHESGASPLRRCASEIGVVAMAS